MPLEEWMTKVGHELLDEDMQLETRYSEMLQQTTDSLATVPMDPVSGVRSTFVS